MGREGKLSIFTTFHIDHNNVRDMAGRFAFGNVSTVRGHPRRLRGMLGIRAAAPRLPLLPLDHFPHDDRQRRRKRGVWIQTQPNGVLRAGGTEPRRVGHRRIRQ